MKKKKIKKEEFKEVKLKSYITCIKKALLQAIGYYNKIKKLFDKNLSNNFFYYFIKF